MFKYNSLYLTSGGIHGYSLLGSIHVLEKLNIFNNFKKIIGNSIGSLIGFLLVLKYTSFEIFSVLKSNNIEDIYFNNILESENILMNLIDNLGLNNANGIVRILELFIKSKNLNSNITFKELYNYNKIELIIVSGNLSSNSLKYFSYKTTPDCSVNLAIKASCGIPILFSPIIYKNNILVDGGFFEFKKNKYITEKTLTLRIRNTYNSKLDISKLELSNYLLFLIQYLIINSQTSFDNEKNTLFLDFDKTGINFNITQKDKIKMFKYGIIQTMNFIKIKRIKMKYFNKLKINYIG